MPQCTPSIILFPFPCQLCPSPIHFQAPGSLLRGVGRAEGGRVCVCVCVGMCACFGSSGRVVGQGWEVSTVFPADVLAAYASDKLPSEGSQLSIP